MKALGRLKEASSLGGLSVILMSLADQTQGEQTGDFEGAIGSLQFIVLFVLNIVLQPEDNSVIQLVTEENIRAIVKTLGVLLAVLAIVVPEKGGHKGNQKEPK